MVNFKKRRAAKTALFSKLLERVEASKGAVKFASATFHLVEAKEFKVKINA